MLGFELSLSSKPFCVFYETRSKMSRPELQNPPEIFYNDDEARKYTRNSRIMEIQSELSDFSLCPKMTSPEVALENEVKGDLLLGDMGQGLGLRSGVIDGAISISAVQWLCNADKSSHNPQLRLKAFFGSLYRCLARGAKAAFQMYPENLGQRELIVSSTMRAGFSGGIVVDYPSSSKKRKEYLVLTCGPPSVNPKSVPKGKSEDEDSSGDEETQTTGTDPGKSRVKKKGKGREWIMKKEQMRRKGNVVPPDTKYTGWKRKDPF